MRRISIVAILVACMAFAATAGAQTLTGTVTGKVVDQQGGVLPGVTVTLTGKTGTQTQVTDAQGEYRFLGLTPGEYVVKAELAGFQPRVQAVDAGIGKVAEVKLTMSVGGMAERVEVVANALSVDTSTAATDTSLAQDLLFNLPMTHANPATNLLNYSPGVNSGSAFGGAADGANSLMLDGVDTRDPEGGTAWVFYNYNIVDEVQVGSLGQPAEYGGFTGAIINTVTKSGGNRFSFLSEYRFSNDSLGSNNVPAAVIAKNATLATPIKLLKLQDYTVQLGGPLAKDKLFFFASVQRYHTSEYRPPVRGEVSPRFNLKLTYQLSPTDTLTGSFQYDNYNQTGRTGLIPGYAVSNHDQTINQDSPEIIYNGVYRKVMGASTFVEAKFTGWWGYYDLNPVSPKPAHFDGDTSAFSGGAGYTGQNDRTRNQLNASLTKYAQAAGQHSFKFGAEIERSTIRDRFAYSGATAQAPTGVFYYDYGGPYLAYGYSYDLQGSSKRESYYAQDQWKINRFTANFGLRYDNVRGYATTTGKELYSTSSFGPRLGAAFDLTGKGTSVLRGYYGQLYDGAVFSSWSKATPGLTPTYNYIVGSNWSSLTLDYTTDRKYSTTNGIKHPRVDEFNVSMEQQFGRDFKLTATGIARDWKNFVNAVLQNATWTPFSYTNPMTSQAMTLYKWANPSNVPSFLIQNTDQVTYNLSTGGTIAAPKASRSYRGLMLVLQKALRNRWQAQASWVVSKTEGTINNSTYAGISSGQFETPNTALVNADGPTSYDRRHEVKIFASYQIPVVEVQLGAYLKYLSGAPYTAYRRLSGSNFGWSSSLNVNLEPLGTHMNDSQTSADIRLEKVFSVGFHRFGVYADVSNLFNTGIVLGRLAWYPNQSLTNPATGKSVSVAFGDPQVMNAGRQVTLAGRWSF
ncbi:MAG: TonB-dependent receptor [Acidobacteriota bacterium]